MDLVDALFKDLHVDDDSLSFLGWTVVGSSVYLPSSANKDIDVVCLWKWDESNANSILEIMREDEPDSAWHPSSPETVLQHLDTLRQTLLGDAANSVVWKGVVVPAVVPILKLFHRQSSFSIDILPLYVNSDRHDCSSLVGEKIKV